MVRLRRSRVLPLGFLLALPLAARQTSWHPQSVATAASLRGLSVVSARVVWASGTGGAWLRTADGGAHWTVGVAPGAERLDFRDVKAFSSQVAYLMAVGAAGGIFKTRDGGAHWREIYTNPNPGFFLDALAFWDANHGLALGDPIHGKFLLLRTADGGATWRPATTMPPALPGEGAFAASGTALTLVRGHPRAWFATGGLMGARVFHSTDAGRSWSSAASPMNANGGSAAAGIFSLAFWDIRHGVAVGGDYSRPNGTARTVALTGDWGNTWQLATGTPPHGYRSAVAFVPQRGGHPPPVLVAVGPTGADMSRDGGNNWSSISDQALNSVAFAADGTGWAVGPHGAVVRFTPPPAPHS